MEISNLGGVFLVLIVGCVFGMFVSFMEMLMGVKQRCDENKVAFDDKRSIVSVDPCPPSALSNNWGWFLAVMFYDYNTWLFLYIFSFTRINRNTANLH